MKNKTILICGNIPHIHSVAQTLSESIEVVTLKAEPEPEPLIITQFSKIGKHSFDGKGSKPKYKNRNRQFYRKNK